MASTFLNLSTDTSLGGNSASDTIVASQKAIKSYADTKQATLVSGTNIKTVNGNSLLGSGNLALSAGDVGVEAYTANEIQAIWEAN